MESAVTQRLEDAGRETAEPSELLTPMQVCVWLGIGRTTLHRFMKADSSFPRPLRLSATLVRFDKAAIREWLGRAAEVEHNPARKYARELIREERNERSRSQETPRLQVVVRDGSIFEIRSVHLRHQTKSKSLALQARPKLRRSHLEHPSLVHAENGGCFAVRPDRTQIAHAKIGCVALGDASWLRRCVRLTLPVSTPARLLH